MILPTTDRQKALQKAFKGDPPGKRKDRLIKVHLKIFRVNGKLHKLCGCSVLNKLTRFGKSTQPLTMVLDPENYFFFHQDIIPYDTCAQLDDTKGLQQYSLSCPSFLIEKLCPYQR